MRYWCHLTPVSEVAYLRRKSWEIFLGGSPLILLGDAPALGSGAVAFVLLVAGEDLVTEDEHVTGDLRLARELRLTTADHDGVLLDPIDNGGKCFDGEICDLKMFENMLQTFRDDSPVRTERVMINMIIDLKVNARLNDFHVIRHFLSSIVRLGTS
jgi:hypothetical protein